MSQEMGTCIVENSSGVVGVTLPEEQFTCMNSQDGDGYPMTCTGNTCTVVNSSNNDVEVYPAYGYDIRNVSGKFKLPAGHRVSFTNSADTWYVSSS